MNRIVTYILALAICMGCAANTTPFDAALFNHLIRNRATQTLKHNQYHIGALGI